jgi:hypothetical protein
MSVREIPTSASLPALKLPPAALSPEDRQYEHDPEAEPSAIEPIEHKLRLDLMAAGLPDSEHHLLDDYSHYRSGPGDPDPWKSRSYSSKSYSKPLALRYAEQTITRQWTSEIQYFEDYESDAVLESAPVYLKRQLRDCREASNPAASVKQERENRKKWYDLMPWKNLYPIFKQDNLGQLVKSNFQWPSESEALHGPGSEKVSFVGVLVISNDSDVTATASQYSVAPDYVYKEEEFAFRGDTELPTPSDYGIDLPAPLLMGQYSNGSSYLFIPWSSGLVCQGPFKTNKPYRVMCKHEALAAFVLSRQGDIFLPVDKGIDVPARARRFVDPTIATSHTSER